jgi:hypothetical protein
MRYPDGRSPAHEDFGGLRSSIDPAWLKSCSLENRRSYTYERGNGHTEGHRDRTSAET